LCHRTYLLNWDMRFSERHGHLAPRTVFQTDSIDASTRNRLINLVIQIYLPNMGPMFLTSGGQYFFTQLMDGFFKQPIVRTDRYEYASSTLIKWAQECEWFRLFDLLEYGASTNEAETRKYFIGGCNQIFEEEKVGYRFVKHQITPITDKVELSSIEQTLSAPNIFEGVRTHIHRALELYSERKNPDYRNAIKEAISAIESAAKVISGKKKATLVDAVNAIDKIHGMHPALKEALVRLYGYSSDKQGIRHALIDAPSVGHAEAKLMLIGCSAFCNYLIEQYGEE
jgi:AbiJ N-terminal domain 4